MAENVCLATASLESSRNVWLQEEALRKTAFSCASGTGKELVSLGPPIKGLTMVAVNPETGQACGEGEIGEMYIRGESVCTGYWKNPKESQHFKMRIAGYDGYFYRTGDMGALHEGRFYMTGRSKEMLVINGENVYPQDIAVTLKKHIAALATDTLVFFTAAVNGRETVVACVETDKTQHDFAILASRINRETARVFEFSFADIVFVRKTHCPVRTTAKSVRTRSGTLSGRDAGRVVQQQEPCRGPQDGARSAYGPGRHPPEGESRVRQPVGAGRLRPRCRLSGIGRRLLRLVECVFRIEEAFGITLDVTKIGPNASVNVLAQYVQSHLLEGGGMGMKTDLQQECTLDDAIVPEGPYDHLPSESKNVFLTGSTGFWERS